MTQTALEWNWSHKRQRMSYLNTILVAKHQGKTKRRKQIDIKAKNLSDAQKNKRVALEHVSLAKNRDGALTKAIGSMVHERLHPLPVRRPRPPLPHACADMVDEWGVLAWWNRHKLFHPPTVHAGWPAENAYSTYSVKMIFKYRPNDGRWSERLGVGWSPLIFRLLVVRYM